MPIDPINLEIRIFDPVRHDRDGFDCGHKRLNNFLTLNAKKQQKDDMARVYVALPEGGGKILGYSAINVGRIEVDDLPKRPRGTPAHGQIPVLFLGQIAVDKAAMGDGIGGVLMHHVFEKAVLLADMAGCHAIILDVVSDDGEAAFERRKVWYARFGFQVFPSNPTRMFMTMKAVRGVMEAL